MSCVVADSDVADRVAVVSAAAGSTAWYYQDRWVSFVPNTCEIKTEWWIWIFYNHVFVWISKFKNTDDCDSNNYVKCTLCNKIWKNYKTNMNLILSISLRICTPLFQYLLFVHEMYLWTYIQILELIKNQRNIVLIWPGRGNFCDM